METALKRNNRLISKKFWEFYLPILLTSSAASIGMILDSVVVGNLLGEDALAAINLLMPLTLCFTAITGMFGVGSSALIASLKGKMMPEEANKAATLSVAAGAVFGIVGILLAVFAGDAVTHILSGRSGLDNLVKDYLVVYLFGAPITLFTLMAPHIIRADGRPKLGSYALMAANAASVILDVVFIKVFDLGMVGAGLATIVGNAIGALILLSYFFMKSRTLRLTNITVSDLKVYWDMFKMGISSIFGQAFMLGKIWIFNRLIEAAAGQAGLTAFSICISCLSFASIFVSCGSQTMMPMVSSFIGANDTTAAEATIKKAVKIIVLCCLGVTVLFECFPTVILRLYGVTSGEVLAIGTVAVRLFSLAFAGVGFTFSYMYYVQMRKMPVFSMAICALEGFFLIVTMGILLGKLFGGPGLWLAFSATEVLVILFIVLCARHISGKSEGQMTGIWMLPPVEKREIEYSVNVSDEVQVTQAIEQIMETTGQRDLEKLLKWIFLLSRYAYEERGWNEKNTWVDIVIDRKRIYFKDMGKAYPLLTEQELAEQVKRSDREYAHTMMIGMNYSSIRRTRW